MIRFLTGLLLSGLAVGAGPTARVVASPPEPQPVVRVLPPPVVVSVSSDGKWVLAGYPDCRVKLWRADGEHAVWSTLMVTEKDPRYHNRTYSALAVGFAADGKRIFCAWAGGVTEADRETGKILRTTKFPEPVKTGGHDFLPSLVAFLPGSDECVYYGDDDRLVRFNFATKKRHPKFDLRLTDLGELSVALNPDGKHVLVYSGTRPYLGEWELETGEVQRLYGSIPNGGFVRAGYYPDGDRLWIQSKGLHTIDRTSGKALDTPEALAKYEGWVWPAPDGKRALALPWKEQKEDRLDVLGINDSKLNRTFSSDGLWYLTRVRKGSPLEPQPGPMAFFPDGRTALLVSCHTDEMGVCDLADGKIVRRLSGFPKNPPGTVTIPSAPRELP